MQGYFDEVITLRAMTEDIKDGFSSVMEGGQRKIYAERKSVGRTEFYLSAQAGMRADIVFALRAADYGQEPQVESDGQVYDVSRTYQRDRDIIELVCVRRD